MRIELTDVSKGRGGEALPSTTIAYESGVARLATAETEQRPTVLGLLATGRMSSGTGEVRIDGRADAAALRRRIALVDAPDVCDPAPDVTVAGVAAEELMFAGAPSHPRAVRAWLRSHDLDAHSRTPIADLEPAARVRMLLELALLRRGVDGVVLVSPDRHGGDPVAWWSIAEEIAARDVAVLVIAGEASAMVLAGAAVRATDPLPPLPEEPEPACDPDAEPQPDGDSDAESDLPHAGDPTDAIDPTTDPLDSPHTPDPTEEPR